MVKEPDNTHGNRKRSRWPTHCSRRQNRDRWSGVDPRRQIAQIAPGLLAAISAFVVMGSDVGATVVASRDRLIGTAIGAALGAAFVALWGAHLVWFGMAVAVTVLVCESLGLGQSYRLACVTVAIVMLINTAGSPWKSATYRFLEVALGIVVALVISALPPKSVDNR
ncbi:MAG: FUSC family protein [Terriglobales bacterium]